MRKIVLALGISIDGYIARPDGTFDFLFMPGDFMQEFAAFNASIDTGIMGRKTYDVSRSEGGGSFGSKMKSYVLSRTLQAGERGGVTFTRQSAKELVKEIRKRKGKDIWLMGGGEVARDFLKADLVDEIHIGMAPVLLGAGIPLFPGGFPQRNFKLMENKSFSKGLVSLKYERLRGKAKKKS
jgi:dihydrofolate reductase